MYRLQITKDYLGFASAHFITFKGDCERLHGHNYQATFDVEGELNPDGYVIDFGDLKRIARQLCGELDHRVLLATENPRIVVRRDGNEISAAYNDRRYVFPASDVALLPISNTTAELLASYLADRMVACLRNHMDHLIHAIGVSVSEGPGQRAYVRKPLH